MNSKSHYDRRINEFGDELKSLYYSLYDGNAFYPVSERFEKLLAIMKHYYEERAESLKANDHIKAHWYKSNKVAGITLYVDLFSGDLAHFYEMIPYLTELGITMIHFMPILEGREGENDGGYAVKDYKNIDPKYGQLDDFIALLEALRNNGIHACIDFVVNHTAMEHDFAKRAIDGDQTYMDMYYMYDTDEIPKAFEATVPEVFPGVAPGNFTYYSDIKKWVFTSFYPFQWDLNYQNPFVFESIVDILLYLANIGVDMIRLDAIPFMWKEIGTTCRNHPTIHTLLRMLQIIKKIVCPSVALLGEAIVEPEEIVRYFGVEKAECDIMYNATRMVNLWNGLATRDARLLQIDGARLLAPKSGCWINYARCHDDIGWGFNETAIKQMGFDPFLHKQFLIYFYKGDYEGSFSIGDLYEYHEDTKDARNCGTLASLCGLEKALAHNDLYQEELAVKRIMLVHSLIVSAKGIPLIYSGDEIAALNDYSYLKDEKKSHDSRWLHRGHFDQKRAVLRHDCQSPVYKIFKSLQGLIKIRKAYEIFTSDSYDTYIDVGNHHVYCVIKHYKDQQLAMFFNFSEDRQFISMAMLHHNGFSGVIIDLITGKKVNTNNEKLLLGPYEFLWLK